ncbi:hypothetical protein DNTS_005714 [Danionella cerebrum]|uniref:Cytochrome c oxidase subunit 6B1 n=1 Tax=Danionella cerebrum TaxID=2873325 RepID=A0A553QSG4_9TELE|nr:hypothetical protein DNTS_005714 [Danionella translucida]
MKKFKEINTVENKTGRGRAHVIMAEDIKEKLANYKTAPFDARFPNQNQTKNCWQNYLDYHRCQKSLDAKGIDKTPCDWYLRVYKSLCPISWVSGEMGRSESKRNVSRQDLKLYSLQSTASKETKWVCCIPL